MQNKNRTIALAVAAALAAPALAMAQSNVQIYGTLNVNTQNTERGGATAVGIQARAKRT